MIPGFTFNGWWGCVPAEGHGGDAQSPACDNCYAKSFSESKGRAKWGAETPRWAISREERWEDPHRWQEVAEKVGEQWLVFAESMGDIAEPRADLDELRRRLFSLAAQTPNLTWLYLTKRPEHLIHQIPADWMACWPHNVALGVTVETPAYLWRIPAILKMPAAVHFVSNEPALSDVDFRPWLGSTPGTIQWVIWGSESGGKARPPLAEWARSVAAQCAEKGAAFYAKQFDAAMLGLGRRGGKVEDSAQFPADLRIRQHPRFPTILEGRIARCLYRHGLRGCFSVAPEGNGVVRATHSRIRASRAHDLEDCANAVRALSEAGMGVMDVGLDIIVRATK